MHKNSLMAAEAVAKNMVLNYIQSEMATHFHVKQRENLRLHKLNTHGAPFALLLCLCNAHSIFFKYFLFLFHSLRVYRN